MVGFRRGHRLTGWPNLRSNAGAACFAMAIATSAGGEISPAHAGAWPRAEGQTLTITTLSVTGAPNRFTANGAATGGAGFEKTELAGYVEHGWRKSTTVHGRVAWQDTISTGERQRGFSSLELGARARLWTFDNGELFAGQVTVHLPLRAHNNTNPLLTSGHADYDLRLLHGAPEAPLWLPGFTDTQLAYRHRGGKAPDELRFDLTYGVNLNDDWLLMLQGQTTATIGKAEPPFTHYRSQKGEASLRWQFDPGRYVQLGAIQTLSGAATVRESGAFIGFWAEF